MTAKLTVCVPVANIASAKEKVMRLPAAVDVVEFRFDYFSCI